MVEYDAVLFDLDGTLLDVTPLGRERYLGAIEPVLRNYGIPATDSRLELFLGSTDVEAVQRCCRRHDVNFRTFWESKEAAEIELQQNALMEGLLVPYDDVSVLDRLNGPVSLGLVSDNQQTIVEEFLDRFDLADRFEHVDGREPTVDGLRRRKPDPSRIADAIVAVGSTPSRTLYVGDSANDVRAACRAGVDGALVRRESPGLDPMATLSIENKPTYVLDSLKDLTTETGLGSSDRNRRQGADGTSE